jgi:hypothetical protein
MARTEVRGAQIRDASVSLTADVTETLPVGNGGTGSATLTLNNVLLGNGTGAVQTSGDALANELFITALAVAATIAAPSGTPANGNSLVVRIKDNGTAQSLSWDLAYRAVGVTLPTTTAAGKTMYLGFKYNSADSKWDCLAVGQEA